MAKISTTSTSIEKHILELLIPEEVLECFELNKIIENEEELLFDMTEKATCIPKALAG